MKAWLALAAAIALEVTGTAALKASDGLSKWPWLVVVLLGYGGAFGALALALKTLPVGLAYAIWSGLGTVGAVLLGRLAFRETLGLSQALGVALIIGGVLVLHLSPQPRPDVPTGSRSTPSSSTEQGDVPH